MRAWAETVRIATVRADTTRLHLQGQEGGLSGSEPLPSHVQPGSRALASSCHKQLRKFTAGAERGYDR
jgi:hypothetical protein